MKIMLVASSRALREMKISGYCRAVAGMYCVIVGPRYCPTSIIMARKPKDAPIRAGGTTSHINGEVDDITMANPSPYPVERRSNRGNCVVNGNISTITQLIIEPKKIGDRLPAVSENLPIKGLERIRATPWLPVIMPIEKKSSFAIPTR